MKEKLLRLLGYRYVIREDYRRKLHTIDCVYGKQIKKKKYLTENQLDEAIEKHTFDNCFYCMRND